MKLPAYSHFRLTAIVVTMAFLLLLVAGCGLTPPKPQTAEEAIDVGYGSVTLLAGAAYKRYTLCVEGPKPAQLCETQYQNAIDTLNDTVISLDGAATPDDLDPDVESAFRRLRRALQPHINQTAQIKELDAI